jgi:DNA polymerase IV (DinB-like DNA polymerase)
VARIASDFQKPDGLTVVEEGQAASFLAPLPVRKIPGIGKKSEQELNRIGIRSIWDLAAYDVQKLITIFGRGGVALHEIALGIDDSEVKERDGMKSVSRETTFEQDTGDLATLVFVLDSLVEDIHRDLVGEELRFRTVTVKIRYEGFVTKTRAKTLMHYTDSRRMLRSVAQDLLRILWGGSRIRLIGLRVSTLEKNDACQMTLDSSGSQEPFL